MPAPANTTWQKLADLHPSRVTPMVRQFMQAKAEAGDALLFFRMGDFYELFFEDALEAAELLGLTLTSRDGDGHEARIPMAGVPLRAAEGYIARAIQAGRTVAICDQVEDPKDAKGIVKRELIRTVTPGTVTEPDLLDERSNNFLAALTVTDSDAGLAFVDVTTGEFLVARVEGRIEQTLVDELARMNPREVLYSEELDSTLLERLRHAFHNTTFTKRAWSEFDVANARALLLDLFELQSLKGVGLEDEKAAAACAGAVLSYVRQTQRETVPHLQMPRRYSPSGYVVLDGNTQRNLELVESLADKSKRGTLLGVLDRTLTSMGGRAMRYWVLHPLLDVPALRQRLDAVETLFMDSGLRMGVRETLKGMGDIERLMGRITSRAANARELKALEHSLVRIPELKAMLHGIEGGMLPDVVAALDPLEDVTGWIATAITDEPPLALNEGNLIRDGYDPELDRLRDLVRGGKDWIAALQAQERARTGINTLKIGYNRVFGYYLEISKASAHLAPPDYIRKQTLANAERFITPAMKEREEEIINAEERLQSMEYDVFCKLRQRVADQATRLYATAAAIATLDVLAALAEVASTRDYTKPALEEGGLIHIEDGRHPVVEHLMRAGEFVPNDTLLDTDASSLHIVTGPNMAGKSTYLRQVALITLMAQMGSFVPARRARVGVVDRIFTRVGASDNLARGESTFMVEMIETANILNTATGKSLLVLDEIGRGTSTFDGISIAWSVAEHIHDKLRAKTLFATHYHELPELGEKLERAKNLNVAVREWGERVVFLYRIVEGGADHSYGIQVAKLAGLPNSVIKRARDILESLEAGNPASAGLPQQMYLFGPGGPTEPSAVEKELELIDPDALSPREAHELICHLKHLLNKPRT
jgi:DNA mismatch repair protein MutS